MPPASGTRSLALARSLRRSLDSLSPPDGEHMGEPTSVVALGRAIADGIHAFLDRHDEHARGLDVTGDSSQQEQSDEVLSRVARSMQQKEGTRFDQVHYDSNIVNFGIGSYTGPRIATLMDTYVTVATEQGSTAALYAYFGGQAAFDGLRGRFAANSVGVPMNAAEKSALETLGRDASLQDAQIRLLAQDVQRYVDSIGASNKYPFIDGYMNGITELAAHVLAHAMHQHGRVNDLIAQVIANHGGDTAFGAEITAGTMTERTFLSELGEAVVSRVPETIVVQGKTVHPRPGVRKRYADLITEFADSGLGYFFDPQPATAHTLAPVPWDDDAPPADDGPSPDAPTPTTVEEIRYALQDGRVNRIARLERTGDQATMIFECLGAEKRASLGAMSDAASDHRPDGYRRAGGRIPTAAAFMTYILLYACGKWTKSYGYEIPFSLDGKSWLGKYAVHNDGPGGPRPTDHPGVDLYEAVAP